MRATLTAVLLLAAPTAMAAHAVTFVIDMRQEIAAGRFDPKSARVGVRGSVAPLSWDTTVLAAASKPAGLYEVTVTFPRPPFGNQPVPYKFKIERPGPPNVGWEEGRNRDLVLSAPRMRVERIFDSPPEPIVPSRVGDLRVHAAFPSKHVPARDVQVWVPPGYREEPSRRYPVLYLQDGQNVFDARRVGMEWRLDETADQLVRSGEVEPFLVVAIDHGEARTDEYTPSFVERRKDGTPLAAGGKAATYARFVLEELKPFVDRTYRTRNTPASTAVGGASHGGLISLYLALEHPEVFGNALVMSSSALWDDGLLIRRVRALPRKLPIRFWVDVGLLEDPWLVSGSRQLAAALREKGWVDGADLRYLEQEDGNHDEISWGSRIPDVLRFLWPRR